MQTITLHNPLDMHIHLREGEILSKVLDFSANSFVGAVVMPNLSTPITTTELAIAYRDQIQNQTSGFEALGTIYITPSLNKTQLIQAKEQNIKILKLYPHGSTTNSENGVKEILSKEMLEILQNAQELGFILSIHAESGGYSLEREFEFLEVIKTIATQFPHLKIIIEHLSDYRSIEVVEKYQNVFATLTLHHITLCLDDLLGGGLNPHLFCKPILKSPKDRDILLSIALKAHPKVSFGSDSAPHLLSKKLNVPASAGIFSAPFLLEQLCELFDKHNALENLQAFVSDNAIKNYELNLKHSKSVTLEKAPCKIIDSIHIQNDCIIPLNAGKALQWRIKN